MSRNQPQSGKLRRAALFSAAALCAGQIATPALAQQQGADEEVSDEIVVTGSRLRRTNESSPIPVTGIDSAEIQASGATSVGEAIEELPALGVGDSRTSSFGTGAPPSLGADILNLRSLGQNRTLVVVDGRRHVGAVAPGGASGVGSTAVDVGSIPTALIERVDVSTGGASVAYGADAVSGVVNLVTRDDFEGVQLDIRGGVSFAGDADNIYGSITAGQNFANGRGNIAANLTLNTITGVEGADRDWISQGYGFVQNNALINPTAPDTGPNDGRPAFILRPNVRIPVLNNTGVLLGLVTGDFNQFDASGNFTSFNAGIPGGNFNVGGDGYGLTDIQRIANPTDRALLNVIGHYDLTPHTRLRLDAKYYRVEASSVGQPTGDFFQFLDGAGGLFLLAPDNPFVPFGDPAFDQFYADNFGFVAYSRFHTDLGYRSAEVERDTYRAVVALEGEFPQLGYDWEIAYQYGRTEEVRLDRNNRNSTRFRLAVDAVEDTTGITGVSVGTPVCRAKFDAYTLSGGVATGDPDIDNCLALNVFGFGNFNPAARDYVLVDLRSTGELTQEDFTASLSGDLADLWAGPLSFAAGFEYRRETVATDPDPLYVAGNTFDGEQLPVSGEYDVSEVYLEAALPILRDAPLARLISIEGGVRASEYSTVGSTTAWRANVDWTLFEGFRVRAGQAEAVRAPNINELFEPVQGGFGGIVDPCDIINVGLGPDPAQRQANCQAELNALAINPATYNDPLAGITKTITVGGNVDLSEETSESQTVGIVFAPPAVPGFFASVDYFDVEILNAVSTLDPQAVVNNCYDRFATINNEFCALFTRQTDGAIQDVVATNINIAALQVEGIDFEFGYGFSPGDIFGGRDWGDVALRVVGTRLEALNVLPTSDATEVDEDSGEIGTPEWRFNLMVGYTNGPFGLNWTTRYIGEGVLDVQATNPEEQRDPFSVGAQVISDVQARWRLGSPDTTLTEFYFGVDNVFNEEPPLITRAGATGAGQSAAYDTIGRFFYGGVRVNW
jgi:iron complex outermembrane recepter protein